MISVIQDGRRARVLGMGFGMNCSTTWKWNTGAGLRGRRSQTGGEAGDVSGDDVEAIKLTSRPAGLAAVRRIQAVMPIFQQFPGTSRGMRFSAGVPMPL
jgi:hypothetical protein